MGGADGEDKEGEDQKEQVINYIVFFVSFFTYVVRRVLFYPISERTGNKL